MSQEVAERKIVAQMSSRDRMSYASVVLSTHWEPEVTQKQVNILHSSKACLSPFIFMY